jgi:DNA topoisomerase-3
MSEIKSLATNIVEETRKFTNRAAEATYEDLLAPCPECGGSVFKQTDGSFDCYNPECKFKLKKHIASYELKPDDARRLLTDRRIGPIAEFKNRFGQPFAADLTLEKKKRTWKVEFAFEGDDMRTDELKKLSEEKVICEVAADTGQRVKVYETDKAFVAPDLALNVDSRGIRISKTILQKLIPTEQGIKLFTAGKTDLIPGFISKKGRPFSAFLKLDLTTGKLEFEFAPRKRAAKK